MKNEFKAAKRERVEEKDKPTSTPEKREVPGQPPSASEKGEVLDLPATQPRLDDIESGETQVSATPSWLREVVDVRAFWRR